MNLGEKKDEFVTYIPRMLPLVMLQNVTLPSYINRFMGFIPYAALEHLFSLEYYIQQEVIT